MLLDKEESDLENLKRIKWKKNLTRKVEAFRDVISDDEIFEKYFGVEYIEKLSEKVASIDRVVIKLFIVYLVLMLSLYFSQAPNSTDFEIFGYGFKNLGAYKEALLFVAAVITPVSAIYSAYKSYMNALIKECIMKISPDERVREYYTHRWMDEYFDILLTGSYRSHGVTKFLTLTFLLVLMFLVMTLVLVSFFVQINVIYDVAKNPSSSEYVNLFVIVFSISSIAFSWLVTLLQFPLPETNQKMYQDLLDLEKTDPVKYRILMDKKSKVDSKRDARSILILAALAYMISYTFVATVFFSSNMDDISLFLAKAMPGAFITMYLSNGILGGIRKISLNWFFRNYSKESDSRLFVFLKLNKRLSYFNFLVPLMISAIYAFYTLS
jgi:hypothetical protein